jgi:hypothetical protein
MLGIELHPLNRYHEMVVLKRIGRIAMQKFLSGRLLGCWLAVFQEM